MAVNTITNLFMGGTRTGSSVPFMLPSSDSGTITTTGYADHQRLRSYQVVRQMRFSPLQPYGGLGNFALTDQKDWEWYNNLVNSGSNVAVDDVWNMIIIPPNTRLTAIAVWVFTGVTSLTFTVDQHDDTGTQIGTSTLTGVGATDMTDPLIFYTDPSDWDSTDTTFVGIHVTAVPSTSGTAKLKNLDFAVQAEVVDWGSFDLNGNA